MNEGSMMPKRATGPGNQCADDPLSPGGACRSLQRGVAARPTCRSCTAVDVYGNRMPKTGLQNVPRQTDERAVLNHYVTRSMEDWRDKERKGGGTHVRKQYGDRVYRHDVESTEVCMRGVEMGRALRVKYGALLDAWPGQMGRVADSSGL